MANDLDSPHNFALPRHVFLGGERSDEPKDLRLLLAMWDPEQKPESDDLRMGKINPEPHQ
ncbi:MAG TPA: hypothetical protein VKB38_10150 [Terracidiphilus sp.]|nr:hypothetical protein [Terracidiphilus sp.]